MRWDSSFLPFDDRVDGDDRTTERQETPMERTHRMTLEADNGTEALFTCPEPGCGRRLVVKRPGGLVVIDQGDFFALHTGGTVGLHVTAAAAP